MRVRETDMPSANSSLVLQTKVTGSPSRPGSVSVAGVLDPTLPPWASNAPGGAIAALARRSSSAAVGGAVVVVVVVTGGAAAGSPPQAVVARAAIATTAAQMRFFNLFPPGVTRPATGARR
ncbi:hypothetical protein ACVDFE_24805 [Lentzea chajnantorensis]